MSKRLIYLISLVFTLVACTAVQADVFIDDFNTPHLYWDPNTSTPNVTGTIWDDFVGFNPGETVTALNASIDRTGQLFISSQNGVWAETWNPLGPFLYKVVKGDFIATVHVTDYAGTPDATVAHNDGGLMARAAKSPVDEAGTGEDWVTIDYFPIWTGNMLWEARDDVRDEAWSCAYPGMVDNRWDVVRPYLRLERSGNTFHFYISPDGTNWEEMTCSPKTRNDFDGLPLQVGLRHATYSTTLGYVAFDDFKLELIIKYKAYEPVPANGKKNVNPNADVIWNPGAKAKSHDVYFGTDPCNLPRVSQGQTATTYDPGTLNYGTTYYWRIDEVNGTDIWTGDVWSFKVMTLEASEPNPADGAECVLRNIGLLTWTPGGKAKTTLGHKVYWGTTYPPGYKGIRTDPNYPVSTLAYNTLYYWRIDEVNGSNTWTGNTWTYRTVPQIPITNTHLVGWWQLDDGCGGSSTVLDSSGYDRHGKLVNGPQWVPGHVDGALEFDGRDDYVELPIGPLIGSLTNSTFMLWMNSQPGGSWVRAFDFGTNDPNVYMCLGPRWWFMDDMYFAITTTGADNQTLVQPTGFDIETGWHHVAVTIDAVNKTLVLYYDGDELARTTSVTLTPSSLGNTTNNWLGRSHNADNSYYLGSMDDFRIYDYAMTQTQVGKVIAPPTAWQPSPADGATDVEPAPTLQWMPGSYAAEHDVYFSSNFDDVNGATTASPLTIYKGRQDPNNYPIPTELNWGDTYYWRIDEINNANIWRGSVWSFTVRNFLHVDDFESYTNSDPNIIFKIWKDGVGYSPGNGTGSQVGYRDPNYAEVTIVHGGAQSMPVDYNNLKSPYYSEADRTFDTPQNWAASGPYSLKSLTLWFRGYPASVGSFVESPAGTYTITASGTDIWDVPDIRHPSRFHDEFHFGYKEVTAADEEEGLVTIVAKVESVTNTNASAKAAVMIRDSLDPNSTHGIMCVMPTSGVAFQRRLETAGASSTTGTTGIAAPYWVKIVLDPLFGNLRAYHSPTGNADDWTQIGESQQITASLPLYVGLAVTAHNAAATCTAIFSNVTITGTGGAGAWKHQDIGIKSNVASPLYVTLQDSKTPTPGTKTVTHSDPNIVLQNTWQAWDIALSDFTGVDLTKIKKITIGAGNRSAPQPVGIGTIYVDDIRLYVPRCISSRVPDSNSNCLIDYQDLAILTDNWTISNWLVTPPVGWNPDSDPNLAAYYAFNGNFNDTSGKGHNGEPNGATIVTDSTRGQVANFDGSNDYVVLPTISSVIGSLNSITIATWVNFSNTGGAWQRIFDFGTGTTVYMFLTPRLDTAGAMRFAITVNGGDATAEQRVTAPSTLASGWHHVAVTINAANDTIRLYLDGLLVAENTAATLTPSDLGNTTNNWLGRSQYAADAYLSGRLDDFRIYSRALSQGEVAYLAGKTTPFTQPLYLLLTPQNSAINLYNDGTIDLRDYAAFGGYVA